MFEPCEDWLEIVDEGDLITFSFEFPFTLCHPNRKDCQFGSDEVHSEKECGYFCDSLVEKGR